MPGQPPEETPEDFPPPPKPPAKARPRMVEVPTIFESQSIERGLTAQLITQAGWRLRWDPEGYRLIAPTGDVIEPDDILFLGPDGRETYPGPNALMTVGRKLYRLLGA